MMRYDEYPDAGRADRCRDGSQVVEQPDFPGDTFDQRPELAAFGQKIIIGIDEEQCRPLLRIVVICHVASPFYRRGGVPVPRIPFALGDQRCFQRDLGIEKF